MRKRGVIISLVVIALIVVAAIAVFLLWPKQSADQTSRVLLDYLALTPEEETLIADGLTTPNASITLDDTTITVTEVLHDHRRLYLAYDIELPEDLPEDAPPPWMVASFCLAASGSEEEDPWHDFYPISEERSGQVIHAIGEAHLGLGAATGDAYDAVLFLTRPDDPAGEDYRELRFPLPGSPLGQTYTSGETVRDGLTLTRLSVSPLSVYALLEGPGPFNGITVCVFFEDGTMFDATRARVSSSLDVTYLEDGTMEIHGCEVGYPFGRILDVSTIERIVVGDVVEVLMD